MSLDVYLYMRESRVPITGSGIFIHENGQTMQITEQEWNEKFPGQQPVKANTWETHTDVVYSANITHNLGKMASEAGVYQVLWRPEEIGKTKAGELIELLQNGLTLLKSEPDRFKQFNPSNGWGNYEGLVQFVENYLNACIEYPDADIEVSR